MPPCLGPFLSSEAPRKIICEYIESFCFYTARRRDPIHCRCRQRPVGKDDFKFSGGKRSAHNEFRRSPEPKTRDKARQHCVAIVHAQRTGGTHGRYLARLFAESPDFL